MLFRYLRNFSFSAYERANPSAPKPGAALDTEFAAIQLAMNDLRNYVGAGEPSQQRVIGGEGQFPVLADIADDFIIVQTVLTAERAIRLPEMTAAPWQIVIIRGPMARGAFNLVVRNSAGNFLVNIAEHETGRYAVLSWNGTEFTIVTATGGYPGLSAEDAAARAEAAADRAEAALAASAIRVVPTADAFPTTDPAGHSLFLLREHQLGDARGGGLFHYDASSTKAVNGGTVFAAPVVGRFLRRDLEELHTSDFGIIDHATLDQSTKLQAFIAECVDRKCLAIVDAGYINCDNAPIYVNSTWTGNAARPGGGAAGTVNGGYILGFTMRGANRNWAQIGRAQIHFGVLGAWGGDGLASGSLLIEDFRVDQGGIVLWSTEVASRFRLRIFVGSGCELPISVPGETTFSPNAGVFAHGCNSFYFDGLRVECPAVGSTKVLDYTGVWIDSCINFAWYAGAVNTLGKGIVFKRSPLSNSVQSQKITLKDIHSEGVVQDIVYIEEGRAFDIGIHMRGSGTPGNGPWDSVNYPNIRLGNSATEYVPTQIHISDSYFNASASPPQAGATGVRVEQAARIYIENNTFVGYETAIDLLAGATQVEVSDGNSFVSTDLDVDRATASTRFDAPESERIVTIPSGDTTLLWRVSAAPTARVNLPDTDPRSFSAMVAPMKGESYTLFVTKAVGGASLTFDSSWKFTGGTPNVASMTTSEVLQIDVRVTELGGDVVTLCSWKIY